MLVIAAVEINVTVGSGPGAVPLSLTAYLVGALLAVPVLFRRRWPFRVLLATAVLMFLYYIFDRRNISPAPASSCRSTTRRWPGTWPGAPPSRQASW